MKNLMQCFKISLFCLCFFAHDKLKAQCPTQLICDPQKGLGLRFDELPSVRTIYFDFGTGDSRTGIYELVLHPLNN